MTSDGRYRIAIDAGGSFTDLIAASDDGTFVEAKVPSDSIRPDRALRLGLGQLANAARIDEVPNLLKQTRLIIHGTTVAINALLQGKGARTALLCTRGFRDTLEIRLGYKEERYNFAYAPPPPLVPRHLRVPVTERIDKNGYVKVALAEAELETAASFFRREGVEAVAICFLWSFLNPIHERRAEKLIRQLLPNVFVSISSKVVPRIREYNRTSTTVLNALLGPTVDGYVSRTETMLRDFGFSGRVRYVQSNGGLAESQVVRTVPVRLLMSGPAAAPAASRLFTGLTGDDVITIDMGGTSFDCTLVRGGRPEIRQSTDIERYRVAVPSIDIHSIGAGGGSIATLHDGLLRVGPESAEANPGPACYQRGGTAATVTDANVVAGFLNDKALLGGTFPISAPLARQAVHAAVGASLAISVEDAAVGIIEVVARHMADAIREITIRRGRDPRDYALVVGGGAGGLHAAKIALDLGIRKVIIPRLASAFCALGAAVADLRHDYTRSVVGDTRQLSFTDLGGSFAVLVDDGVRALKTEGALSQEMKFTRTLDLRYKGQVYECSVDVSELDFQSPTIRDVVEDLFHERHQELYDYSQPGYPCEIISMTVTAIGHSAPLRWASDSALREKLRTLAHRQAHFARGDSATLTPVFDGLTFPLNAQVTGPAIVDEPHTTIVVPPDWTIELVGPIPAYVLRPPSRDVA